MYLKALELLEGEQREKFITLYQSDESNKVEQIKTIFKSNGVDEYSRQLRDAYHDLAMGHFQSLTIEQQLKDNMRSYLNLFINREA